MIDSSSALHSGTGMRRPEMKASFLTILLSISLNLGLYLSGWSRPGAVLNGPLTGFASKVPL